MAPVAKARPRRTFDDMSVTEVRGFLRECAMAGEPVTQTDDYGRRAVLRSTEPGLIQKPGAGVLDAAAWEALGPFGGDADDVAASPADPNIVLCGLAPSLGGGGLYRSTDAGAT